MHMFRDSASIHEAITILPDPELRQLIASRVQELSEYEDYDLAELINILVIAPGDALTTIDAELVFSLVDRPIDVIESHAGWYELTVVLSDDGFGVVIFIPKSVDIPDLRAMCQQYPQDTKPAIHGNHLHVRH